MKDLSSYEDDLLFDTSSTAGIESISKTLPPVVTRGSTLVVEGKPQFKAVPKIQCPRCRFELTPGRTTITFKHAPVHQAEQSVDGFICDCGEVYVSGAAAKIAFERAMRTATPSPGRASTGSDLPDTSVTGPMNQDDQDISQSEDRGKETRTACFEDWVSGSCVALAIVCTDIVSSTTMQRELGAKSFDAIRRRHFEQASKFVDECSGYLVKTVGDGCMVAFKSAVDALEFAVKIHGDPGHETLRIRAGIHVGVARKHDDELQGAVFDFASRITQASRSGLCVSNEAKEEIYLDKPSILSELRWHKRLVDTYGSGPLELWSLRYRSPSQPGQSDRTSPSTSTTPEP